MLSRLPFELIGKSSSQALLIFLHGWPDTYQLWDPLINSLSDDFLCLNISYPNFSGMSLESKWGYDFPVIAEALRKTIDDIPEIKEKEKIVVAHDWGCFYAYLFDKNYPRFFDSMVSLDVAPYIENNPLIPMYQLSLATAFLVDGFLGRLITKKFLKLLKYESPWEQSVSSHLNYPYYYLWKNIIKSKFGLSKQYLDNYSPSIPITYVYGKDKAVQFQSKKWFDWLEQNEGKCIGVEGGHWIMNNHPELLVNIIRESSKKYYQE